MDARTRRLNEILKGYDDRLCVRMGASGIRRVYRERPVANSFVYGGKSYVFVKTAYDWVISLTDDWSDEGRPVDWGIEPLWRKFLQMDSWRDDTGYERFVERRRRYEQDQERFRRNEFRARAADARKDFAKATNDIVVKQESLDTRRNY